MIVVMRSTMNATFKLWRRDRRAASTIQQHSLRDNGISLIAESTNCNPLPGCVMRGSGQFLVALRSNDSPDLTLFVDGLSVLVRRCVDP